MDAEKDKTEPISAAPLPIGMLLNAYVLSVYLLYGLGLKLTPE